MPATFESLTAMVDRLVRAGHNSMTPWWRGALQPWYEHPTAKVFVGRVGRGGIKSCTSVYVGTNEILNGDWLVPPGEIHYWAQVSENKTEAAERLRLYEAVFTSLKVKYERSGDAIIIPELRRGVRVLACQVGAVSGFRCFGYSADEAAKWSDDSSVNPAREVCASLDAMTITYPGARSLIISSPWGTEDLHYELFEKGDNEFQVTAYAPTWVANPSITFEQCVAKAKGDQRILDREYRALAGLTVDAALDHEDVPRCFCKTLSFPDRSAPFCSIDSSKLRNDEFVVLFGGTSTEGVLVDCIGAWDPTELRTTKLSDICDQIAERCNERGIRTVFGDDFESLGITSELARHSIGFTPYAWSEPSKDAAFQLLRRLMRDRQLQIVEHDKLRKELLACKAHLRPNGRTSYPTNGLDYLSALISAMHAINDNKIELGGGFDWRAFHQHWRERREQRLTRGGPWSPGIEAERQRAAERGEITSILDRSPQQRAADTSPYYVPRRHRRSNGGRNGSFQGF
jgi:hypothetical protein